jgi:hypothetical protein
MDPVYATMLDAVRIATFQPRATNIKTWPRERELTSRDTVTVHELAPAAARAVTREAGRLRGWFRFSFLPRL